MQKEAKTCLKKSLLFRRKKTQTKHAFPEAVGLCVERYRDNRSKNECQEKNKPKRQVNATILAVFFKVTPPAVKVLPDKLISTPLPPQKEIFNFKTV